MATFRSALKVRTNAPLAFIDITGDVTSAVKKSGMKEGFVLLSSQHTTTALCINEKCERLQEDMKELLQKLAPPDAGYKHNHGTVDGRSNAHSHLLSLLLKTNEVIQISDGELSLGTWQSVFLIELDGPRRDRTVNVMVVGE